MDATLEAKIDKASLRRIATLDPKIREEIKEIYIKCLNVGVRIIITEALRSIAYQNCLYAQGRETPAQVNARRKAIGLDAISLADAKTKVTNAKGGTSWHNYGLAVDFALYLDAKKVVWNEKIDHDKDGIRDWAEVVKIFKEHGYEWGGDFKTIYDAPHFQKRFGLSIATAAARIAKSTTGYVTT